MYNWMKSAHVTTNKGESSKEPEDVHLGKIDIEKEGLLGIGHLNPVLLWGQNILWRRHECLNSHCHLNLQILSYLFITSGHNLEKKEGITQRKRRKSPIIYKYRGHPEPKMVGVCREKRVTACVGKSVLWLCDWWLGVKIAKVKGKSLVLWEKTVGWPLVWECMTKYLVILALSWWPNFMVEEGPISWLKKTQRCIFLNRTSAKHVCAYVHMRIGPIKGPFMNLCGPKWYAYLDWPTCSSFLHFFLEDKVLAKGDWSRK